MFFLGGIKKIMGLKPYDMEKYHNYIPLTPCGGGLKPSATEKHQTNSVGQGFNPA
jgi:hypothetical protein